MKQRPTDMANRLVVASGRGHGGEKDWECGMSRCKLICIGWINKILLYSMGNYVQCPVISYNEKEYNK